MKDSKPDVLHMCTDTHTHTDDMFYVGSDTVLASTPYTKHMMTIKFPFVSWLLNKYFHDT